MPNFRVPGPWPGENIYPREAGRLIEGLRRFIGHDHLLAQMRAYRSLGPRGDGVFLARLRERQPLIEAFERYEKATLHRARPLRSIDAGLADLANVAAHCSVVAPTLVGALKAHHKKKLIDLNGQLKPLLLEWKTASQFYRTTGCEIAWLETDKTGPEFVAKVGAVEWEVECKLHTQMVTELLGQSEADTLASAILDRIFASGFKGNFILRIPDDFDATQFQDRKIWTEALSHFVGPGALALDLPGGLVLEGESLPVDNLRLDVHEWRESMASRKIENARLYARAGAERGAAINPIELQLISRHRQGLELFEYLWDRKFSRAAGQCTGERGAVLVFEWEGLDDPSIFAESPTIQALLNKTMDEHRHVAAIAMRCDPTPHRQDGLIDYSTGAYLAKSAVTAFPSVLDFVRIDEASLG